MIEEPRQLPTNEPASDEVPHQTERQGVGDLVYQARAVGAERLDPVDVDPLGEGSADHTVGERAASFVADVLGDDGLPHGPYSHAHLHPRSHLERPRRNQQLGFLPGRSEQGESVGALVEAEQGLSRHIELRALLEAPDGHRITIELS